MVLLRLSRSRTRISQRVARRAASYHRKLPPKDWCDHSNLESYRLGAGPRLCFEKYVDVRADPFVLVRELTKLFGDIVRFGSFDPRTEPGYQRAPGGFVQ
jgi:hypothetical protein